MEVYWFSDSVQRSLKARLIVPINLISFFSLMLLCIVISLQINQSFHKMMSMRMESTLAALEATSRENIENYDLTTLEKIAKANLTDSDVQEVRFIDAGGKEM